MESVGAHLSIIGDIAEQAQLELTSHLIRIERLELKGPGTFEYTFNIPLSAFYSRAISKKVTNLTIELDGEPHAYVVSQLTTPSGEAIEDHRIEATSSEEGIHLQVEGFDPTIIEVHKDTNPMGEIFNSVHKLGGIKPLIYLRHPTNRDTIARLADIEWDFGRATNYASKQHRHFTAQDTPSDSDDDSETPDDNDDEDPDTAGPGDDEPAAP